MATDGCWLPIPKYLLTGRYGQSSEALKEISKRAGDQREAAFLIHAELGQAIATGIEDPAAIKKLVLRANAMAAKFAKMREDLRLF